MIYRNGFFVNSPKSVEHKNQSHTHIHVVIKKSKRVFFDNLTCILALLCQLISSFSQAEIECYGYYNKIQPIGDLYTRYDRAVQSANKKTGYQDAIKKAENTNADLTGICPAAIGLLHLVG